MFDGGGVGVAQKSEGNFSNGANKFTPFVGNHGGLDIEKAGKKSVEIESGNLDIAIFVPTLAQTGKNAIAIRQCGIVFTLAEGGGCGETEVKCTMAVGGFLVELGVGRGVRPRMGGLGSGEDAGNI